MGRWMGTLMLIAVMLPLTQAQVHGASVSPSLPLASEVALTVSLPGRPSFQRNALADVAITLTNVSGHDIRLATATCRLPYLFAEVVSSSGKVLFPPPLASEPETA